MCPRLRADAGAAVVDFVLVAVLLVMLLLGVLQTAVYFYAENIVAASAADGARYAAAEGVPAGAGGVRAEAAVRQGLDAADAAAIHCSAALGVDRASGLVVTTVHCAGRLRLLFLPLGLPLTVDATSSALREGRP
jgi:Flp pilus assembly protein TadG